MIKYKHILLATDLSDNSYEIAQKALAFAKQFQAKLTIVHAIEPIPDYGYIGMTDFREPVIEHGKRKLLELAEKLNVPEEDIKTALGPVKHVILDTANELGVDLILIGSHGRHGLSRLLGSGANAIVHGADCDVFVLRSS